MAIAERTYSFRADAELGRRIKAAIEQLSAFADDEGAFEQITRHISLALYRNPGLFANARDNQSALLRNVVELFVAATEKLAEDRRLTEEYAKLAEDLTDEEREGAAAMRRLAAERWRDD